MCLCILLVKVQKIENYKTVHIPASPYSLDTISCTCSCQVALHARIIPVIFITLMRFISCSGGRDISDVVEKQINFKVLFEMGK